MTVLIVFILILAAAYIYLAMPGGNLRRQFLNDVQLSLNEIPREDGFFTADTISELPSPLQKYLTHRGYVDKPLMSSMHIDYKDARLSMSEGQAPMKIKYEQYNFAKRPDRHAFVDAKIMGAHIFYGKDTLANAEGSMTIVLAKLITIGKTTGAEMSQSQLVTALADAVLMPSLFLQDYVEWTPIDDTHAECRITWGGVTASGTFTFNADGEITRFDTNDRYQDNNGVGVNLLWTVEFTGYKETDGYLRPSAVKVYWHLPDGGVYTYFESDEFTVIYT